MASLSVNLVLLALCAIGLTAANSAQPGAFSNGKKLVCYWGTWAVYRPGNGKFTINDVDPYLCTHIVYGFAGLRNGELASLDPYLDEPGNWGGEYFVKVNDLKKNYNPNLKTILAIGGWNEGSTKYSEMASTSAGRAKFIASVVPTLLEYGFDGFDVDWEYPTERGGAPEDYVNFILLLKELREAFKPYGLLLTAAVSAGQGTIESGYNVAEMDKYLDILSIMAYDYYGAWNTFVQHNAPLEHHPLAVGNYSRFNVRDSIQIWTEMGATPSKMVLGMPLYGRGYRLDDGNVYALYSDAQNPCEAGPYTREKGILGFNEICEIQNDPNFGFKRYWDKDIMAPFGLYTKSAWAGTQWIGYDDQYSLNLKMDIIDEFGLGGGMVWSIETDDFTGICGMGKYPLLTTISERLNGGTIPTAPPGFETTTTTTTTTTAATTTTTTAGTGTGPTSAPEECESCSTYRCKYEGLFALGTCCDSYCTCIANADGTFRSQETICGLKLVFNPLSAVCDWEYNVPACNES